MTFSPGYAFTDGKFYRYGRETITVMKPWPKPRAWRLSLTHRRWTGSRPDLNLRSLRREHSRLASKEELVRGYRVKRDAIGAFLDLIPDEVVRVLCRYGDRHWQMLSYVARCPGGMDLVESNPALAYMLASNWCFKRPRVKHPMRAARRLTNRKQREIAGWLDFPPTESIARVLRKVPPRSANIPGLRRLRKAVEDPEELKLVRHLPRINAGVLRMLSEPALQVDYNLLAHVGDRRTEDLRPKTIWKLLRSAEFPPPPIEGTSTIIPITSHEMLEEEAKEQQNCVLDRLTAIHDGREYLYRVLEPERATLSLWRTSRGWKVGELRARNNREVKVSTRRIAEEWVRTD